MINYPMQPLKEGRFEANPIVEWLATECCDMNKIAVWCAENNTDNKYKEQLAQLVGYSLSGYGTLSYVSDESYNRAAALEIPKRTRTEYEKVTESIFGLKGELEHGELYFKCSEGDWVQAVHESEVVTFFRRWKALPKSRKRD